MNKDFEDRIAFSRFIKLINETDYVLYKTIALDIVADGLIIHIYMYTSYVYTKQPNDV